MSASKTRAKFQSSAPITSRPEERIAAKTAERRATAAANRPRRFTRPSKLTAAILFFATLGLAVAIYTLVVHYVGPGALVCGANGAQSSCAQVQFSVYNNVAGIPVSLLGVIGYLTIFGSLLIRNDYGRALGFGTALIGFLFSLYLTYREAFSLKKYCEYCLTSAGCMTILVILLGIQFVRSAPAAGGRLATSPLTDLDDSDLDEDEADLDEAELDEVAE